MTLARPIILSGVWEVGLSEIFVPRTWLNIGNHNNKYSITYEETKIVEKDYVEHEIRVKIDEGTSDKEVIAIQLTKVLKKMRAFCLFCIGSKEYNCVYRPEL
ncbi:uncharacterized protein TNCT_353151 [Trichonephila clavata]|uniref:Uncharacterized protein n=1 Tax=Trichonephila clavata TaxID=2740835 RepID=A0A8X6HZ24_TRICU|nr:uncharacterized protein TNCT_353151 [Trichonephila clavata]